MKQKEYGHFVHPAPKSARLRRIPDKALNLHMPRDAIVPIWVWRGIFETIKTCVISNCGEFTIIKIRIIHFLTNTDKLQCVTVAQPVGNDEISVLGTQHVSKTDIVLSVDFYNLTSVSLTVIFVISA